jgi:hypothetical protein
MSGNEDTICDVSDETDPVDLSEPRSEKSNFRTKQKKQNSSASIHENGNVKKKQKSIAYMHENGENGDVRKKRKSSASMHENDDVGKKKKSQNSSASILDISNVRKKHKSIASRHENGDDRKKQKMHNSSAPIPGNSLSALRHLIDHYDKHPPQNSVYEEIPPGNHLYWLAMRLIEKADKIGELVYFMSDLRSSDLNVQYLNFQEGRQ